MTKRRHTGIIMNLIEKEKPEARERLTGVLAEWNDSRGFGWVAGPEGCWRR